MRDSQTIVDHMSVAHLDEEWALPCEVSSHRKAGTGPAAWVLWFSCCPERHNGYILACDGCKEFKLNYPVLRCDCGEVFAPGRLAYRKIDALNKT